MNTNGIFSGQTFRLIIIIYRYHILIIKKITNSQRIQDRFRKKGPDRTDELSAIPSSFWISGPDQTELFVDPEFISNRWTEPDVAVRDPEFILNWWTGLDWAVRWSLVQFWIGGNLKLRISILNLDLFGCEILKNGTIRTFIRISGVEF